MDANEELKVFAKIKKKKMGGGGGVGRGGGGFGWGVRVDVNEKLIFLVKAGGGVGLVGWVG